MSNEISILTAHFAEFIRRFDEVSEAAHEQREKQFEQTQQTNLRLQSLEQRMDSVEPNATFVGRMRERAVGALWLAGIIGAAVTGLAGAIYTLITTKG